VAGVPQRWSFDPGSRRFRLAYSTHRKGGGSFAFRADTQVFVPRLQYPRGYHVRVAGGEALSRPGSTRLRIRTCSGRRRVALTVVPGAGRFRADCRAPRRAPSRIRVRAGRAASWSGP
jgi:endoglycosylceramidase